jgi:hypothetical protein
MELRVLDSKGVICTVCNELGANVFSPLDALNDGVEEFPVGETSLESNFFHVARCTDKISNVSFQFYLNKCHTIILSYSIWLQK